MNVHRWGGWPAALILALVASRAGAQASVSLLPQSPTTLDRLQITVVLLASCQLAFSPPQVSDTSLPFTIRIDAVEHPPCPLAPPSYWTQVFVVGPLPAGTFFLTVHEDQNVVLSSQFSVIEGAPPPTELFLNQARFQADVSWQSSQAEVSGYARPISDETGYFWFFEPGNAEVTIKILDGRAVNGHFWVFISSITDVGYTAVVYDRGSDLHCLSPLVENCPKRAYANPRGRSQNFVDTNAF